MSIKKLQKKSESVPIGLPNGYAPVSHTVKSVQNATFFPALLLEQAHKGKGITHLI